ncbi:acyltransferase domain-containing protein [Actinophytocola sp.]|uniref:acyltransferase domain-containing protein n=1 Tax=Actinophytocola sp. TaxID=1872138 RepID=UPI003D6AB868
MSASKVLLFAVSAPSGERLAEQTASFVGELESGLVGAPAAAAGSYRRVVVADGYLDAARRLRAARPDEVFTATAGPPRPVVLMVSGVGDEYPGMAEGLFRHLPVFRRELTRCLRVVTPALGIDLRGVLYPPDGARHAPTLGELFDQKADTQEIHRTMVAQPLAFVTRYALARTLVAMGVTPSALLGYSVGEFVCACLTGVFALEDALRVIAARARLVDALPEGAMLAVASGPEPLETHLVEEGVHVAALDGPELTVLAGPVDAVERVRKRLADHEIAGHRLPTTHAFHSPMMAPIVDPLRELLTTVRLSAPSVPFLSNVTGTWIRPEEAASPDYWASHLCRPIRFADNLARLGELDQPIPIEIGPGQTLTNLAVRHIDCRGTALRTLPGVFESRGDLEVLLTAVGRLWAEGADVDLPPSVLGAHRSGM